MLRGQLRRRSEPNTEHSSVLLSSTGASAGARMGIRPAALGKFLFVGDEKLYVRGVTYGAFKPDADGNEFHDLDLIERDFALMAAYGMNAVRIPHTMPPVSLLDAAERHGLRVMVGLSAEQYAGYLADRKDAPNVERIVRERVRAVAGHPAILCYALGNEIPAPMVRWLGRRPVEKYLEDLYEAVKDEDPNGIVTYVNYPSTEYLQLPFLDLVAFNVYLERQDRLEAYLARLHNLAGDRPVLMSELGLDALRNGEHQQARILDWQVRTTFAGGCSGAFIFAWTDEWFRADADVDDWAFGLTRRDRSPKPALDAVRDAFADVPFPDDRAWPSMSAVVCTYNGSRTLAGCLEGLARVEYPDLEVIVIDDGSTDDSSAIAEEFGATVIRQENGGLSTARNAGAQAASGEIVAYLDDDTVPDPHWAMYLADTFLRTGCAAVGGPNIPPLGEDRVAECVAHSPGGPIHVLVSDTEAEHLPGCNLAVRKEALNEVGGFDPQFRAAGDDVDFCWRLEESGRKIRFNPAASVWHYRRNSVLGYWRQQRGYGRAEALLERKWPARFNAAGHVSWGGRVYGNSFARALGFRRSRVYNGAFGFAPFQSLYETSAGLIDSLARMPEWYLVIVFLGGLSLLGTLWAPLLFSLPLLAAAVLLLVADAVYSGVRTSYRPRPGGGLAGRRALTVVLHLLQPLARLVGRVGHGLSPWAGRVPAGIALPFSRSLAIWRDCWRPPEELLAAITAHLSTSGLAVRHGGDFDRWDFEARCGTLGAARLLFAAEDHGGGHQLLRVRTWPRPSKVGLLVAVVLVVLAAGAELDGAIAAAVVLDVVVLGILVNMSLACAAAIAALRRAVSYMETAVAEDVSLPEELIGRAHDARGSLAEAPLKPRE